MLYFRFLLFITVLFEAVNSEYMNDNVTASEFEATEASKVLSRRKRFLIFPVGSSLQLVFCLQTAAIIPIGDIFLYGNTAALAWNLPSDPTFFDHLKEKERAQRRGDVVNKIGFLDENGRLLAKVPYKRRKIVNPAFAKRSIEDRLSFKEKLKLKIDRLKMHQEQSQRDYLKREDLDKKSIEFHRSSRLELFGKIETLMSALGKDGRQCVLYKLCESAQRAKQGSFMQEFFRAVFTLPKGAKFDEDHHRLYDEAHSETTDCISKYPGCDNNETP